MTMWHGFVKYYLYNMYNCEYLFMAHVSAVNKTREAIN
jgi:hypothetical protein